MTVRTARVENILSEDYSVPNQLEDIVQKICSDLYRYEKKVSIGCFLKYLFNHKGFIVTFHYRIAHYLYRKRVHSPFFKMLSILFNYWIYRPIQIKYNTDIHPACQIGPGLVLNHVYGTVIHPHAKLGKNLNIAHFVTIGEKDSGPYQGCPKLGDCIYVAPGAKIIGNVRIGNYATIGANAVVAKDVQDYAVVGGIPAKLIAIKSHQEHICNPV